MRRKEFIIITWFLPTLLVIAFLVARFTQLLEGISIRIPALIVTIASIFLNAIVFRPEDGSTRPENPLPKMQIQRLLHAVFTAIGIFLILKFMQ